MQTVSVPTHGLRRVTAYVDGNEGSCLTLSHALTHLCGPFLLPA